MTATLVRTIAQYANENQFNEILLTEQDLVHGGSQSTELLHGAAKFFLRKDRGGIHGKLPDFRGFWEKDRAFVRFLHELMPCIQRGCKQKDSGTC